MHHKLFFKYNFRASQVVLGRTDLPMQETRDAGLIPGLGRSPGEGNGNPLQYSCLENPTDRGAWQATVHGVTRIGHDLVTKPPPYFYKIELL